MNTAELQAWEKFCDQTIKKQARNNDVDTSIPQQLWKEIADRGYFEIFHKGSNGKLAIEGNVLYRAMEALAEACASTFWAATISSALAGRMISELCGHAMREQWVPKLSTGTALGCFAATERGSGSDPASYQTTVHNKNGRWILKGEKTRVANAPNADVAVVLTNAVGSQGENLGLALVVLDLNKHRVGRTRHGSLGLRGMTWGTLHFDSLELEEDEITFGITMAKTLQTVEWGQVIQTVSAIGLAQSALKAADTFVSSRPPFGKNLGEFTAVRGLLDSAYDEIEGVRIYAKKAIALKARGEIAGQNIVISKIYSTEASVRACETALRCTGGWGYTTELEVERFLRDAYGNIPAGLPNDRLRELLISPRLGIDPWQRN